MIGGKFSVDILIKPSKYRQIDKMVKKEIEGGYMEIIDPHFANRETVRLEDTLDVNIQLRDQKLDPYISSSDSETENPAKEDQKYCEPAKKKKSKKKKAKKDDQNFVSSNLKNQESASLESKREEEETKTENDSIANKLKEELKSEMESKKYKCTTCIIGFEDNNDFKKHWKSEWHVFNIKRKSEVIPFI